MSTKNFLKTRLFFLSLILLELTSFFCYLFPIYEKMAFSAIIIFATWLCFKDLKFGLLLIFIELIIGSKGYLFYFDGWGVSLSIRMALWIIVMSFWFVKFCQEMASNKKILKERPSLRFFYTKYFKYFFVLFLFILWGVVRGWYLGNDFGNLFFDLNGWLFFFLALPLFSEMKKKEDFNLFLKVGLFSALWLSIKTFILLFLFSHNIYGITYEIYRWVRVTGVGEITQIQGGFYRIFFQSHIFVLIGFFIFLFFISSSLEKIKDFFRQKDNLINFSILSLFLSVVVLSFSRSFWLALATCFLLFLFIFFVKYDYKKVFQIVFIAILSSVFGLILIIAVVKFPYPDPMGGFDPARLISDRATQIKGEAAASSRWNLLPELMLKIDDSVVFGKGFGATVTYKSNDPRIAESTVDGEYTTYAFEWGWLDIWLKLGILGLASYCLLILKMLFSKISFQDDWFLILGFKFGLVLIMIVSIFTPYSNHPLGMGYIIFTALLLEYLNKKSLA